MPRGSRLGYQPALPSALENNLLAPICPQLVSALLLAGAHRVGALALTTSLWAATLTSARYLPSLGGEACRACRQRMGASEQSEG
jgi:hypothetical protein